MQSLKQFMAEAKLTQVLEIKVDYTKSFPTGSLKRTEAEELKQEWDVCRSEVKKVVKPLGGLVTDTTSPSPQSGKRVGTISVGTRGDASKLDVKKIKAALKNVDTSGMTITKLNESTTHCSDKCCGADVKAEDCKCPPDCPHCDCNAE